MLLALAPMKDITDLAFLRVLTSLGTLPDYFITEYFRSSPHHSKPDPKILRSIDENPTRCPIYAQFVGSDRDSLVRDARLLMEHPVAGVDLNMGCPAHLVCHKNAGGGLLRKLRTMDAILGGLRDALPEGAFTVKCRLGWEDPQEFSAILGIIAKHCPDRLAIHGRTVREGYRSPVHPEWIAHAVEVMPCPVIANGNIVDPATASVWMEQCRPAGFMIGRAAIRNPWIFDQLRASFCGKPVPALIRRDLYRYALLLSEETAATQDRFDEKKHVNSLKKFMVYMTCGLPDAFGYAIRRVATQQEFQATCAEFLDNKLPVDIRPPEHSPLFAHHEDLLSAGRERDPNVSCPREKGSPWGGVSS